jgi:hypothetical protein
VSSDANGGTDITSTHVLFASTTRPAMCYAALLAPNSLYLINDAASGWLGPVPLGTAASLENSQCRVNAAGSGVMYAGNNQMAPIRRV